VLVSLAASCGAGSNDAVVETDVDAGEAFAMAGRASQAAGADRTARTTPDGVELSVDASYFQPMRVPGWTAPDECAFNTLLEVEADGSSYRSPPFDGPSSDVDLGRDGALGSAISTTAPGSEQPVLLVLVAVFTHDAVVTITLPDEFDHGSYSDLDTQPADGWTVLALLAPTESVRPGEPVVVRVASEDADGRVESSEVEIAPIGTDGLLSVLTPTWVFDVAAVGPQCQPPSSTPSSLPVGERPTPMFGPDAGAKPELPPPGPTPNDAPAATADALSAFRTVYDIGDLYDEGKANHIEQPDLALEIFREVRARRVVEPFIPQLAPVFDSVVFVSPTEAAVLYRVGPSYRWEIGRVLLIDGTWRVALGTLCRDLGDAGYQCPGVIPDPRPGPLG
jgi:hypothetical protein